MAISTEAQPFSPVIISGAVGLVLGVYAAAGALGSLFFTTVSPLGGMIYGVSSAIGSLTIDWICDKVGCDSNSLIARVAKAVTVFFGSVIVGIAAAALFGFTVPFTAGILISLLPATLCTLAAVVATACRQFSREDQLEPARV